MGNCSTVLLFGSFSNYSKGEMTQIFMPLELFSVKGNEELILFRTWACLFNSQWFPCLLPPCRHKRSIFLLLQEGLTSNDFQKKSKGITMRFIFIGK